MLKSLSCRWVQTVGSGVLVGSKNVLDYSAVFDVGKSRFYLVEAIDFCNHLPQWVPVFIAGHQLQGLV